VRDVAFVTGTPIRGVNFQFSIFNFQFIRSTVFLPDKTTMSEANEFSLGSVEVSSSPLERFEEYFASRGKRFTQQRRALVETVFSRHEHFEADDLVEELSYGDSQNRIGRATIYRTLNEMVDAGLLRKLELTGRSVYEHDYGYPQHDHLHCQSCDKLIEFQSEELIRIRKAVAQEHKFQIQGYRLVITGICNECRKKRRRRKRPVDLV